MLFEAGQIVSTCLKSVWFIPGCFMLFVRWVLGMFQVVFGGFWFFDVRAEMSALAATIGRVSATTLQQHHHPDTFAKRF